MSTSRRILLAAVACSLAISEEGAIQMFEQEIEMEQRQSSVVPLLLIIAMILAFVGVAAYYVVQNRKVLTAVEADSLVNAFLKSDGPVMIHFQAGKVTASVQERPNDPNYRLLEKAGLLKIGKDSGRFTPIELTQNGRTLLGEIPGVVKSRDQKDAADSYLIPVAEKKLVGTPTIIMTGMGRARVEFAWGWAPNKMGELLDASGPLVKSFSTWDRATLIDKYGAKFYHGEPSKVAVNVVRNDGVWRIATE
jgi:hypothetical protein